MKRTLIVFLFLALCLFPIGSIGKQPPCAKSLKLCKAAGCSKNDDHDPDLNKLKNLKSSTKPVADRTLTEMIEREQKVEDSGYKRGDDRKPLKDLDEGTQTRVVGYLLAVKKEHGESCNCHLDIVDVTTDNHLVPVNPDVVTDNPLAEPATPKELSDVFHVREAESVTAEFTPRVRANHHPNFTSALQKRLNKTKQGALWVRVTGQLMFDSEHFHNLKLNRATQWEIHPILKLEYCSKGKTCPKDGDTNWVDLDDQP